MAARRFSLLLLVLVVLLLLHPFVHADPVESVGFALVSSGVLLGALIAVARTRAVRTLGVLIALPAVALDWIGIGSGNPPVMQAGAALEAVFFLYCAGVVFAEVFRPGTPSTDDLAGAACVYFLLGLAFTSLCVLLESLVPGSFHTPDIAPAAGVWAEFLFYSFTTLTTLGYGDITPLSPHARALATLESTLGVLYVAILVARLVGAYQAEPA